MATTPDAQGYWLVALDGGVFAYGDAAFYGSMGSTPLNQPIVGMASTPDERAIGWSPQTAGSSPSETPVLRQHGQPVLNAPIVGMASTPDGKGYGGRRDGGTPPSVTPRSTAGRAANLPDPVVGMVRLARRRGVRDGDAERRGVAVRRRGLRRIRTSIPRPHRSRPSSGQPRNGLLAARPAGLAVQLLHRDT